MEPTFRRYLETSLGSIQIQNIDQYSLLPHEYLQHQTSKDSIGQINLASYRSHLKNPYNTTNTSINPTLILHQIQHIHKPLILDCSLLKSISSFKDVHIIKGSKVLIEAVSKQEGDYLYAKSTIKQNLQNSLVLSEPKASFIGQFALPEINIANEYHLNHIEAGLQVCKERGCFALFNMINSKNPQVVFENNSTHYIQSNYQKILRIIQINKKYNAKIVLFNPLISLTIKAESNQIIKYHQNHKVIEYLRQNHIIIGYDLSRYQSDQDVLYLIVNEINTNPDSTIISTGIMYKTDLTSYGGNGWKRSEAIQFLESKVSVEKMDKSRRNNMIRLLFWRNQEIKIKPIQYWKCSNCNKESTEDVQKFKKMGKEFCTTACIRMYKF